MKKLLLSLGLALGISTAAQAQVEIGLPTGPDGWADATADGAPTGRVRPHHRMKFRRD